MKKIGWFLILFVGVGISAYFYSPELKGITDSFIDEILDNKNDSIEYLNKDRSYRNMAIKTIFIATKF